MEKLKETTAVENRQVSNKEMYVKPESEVIKMELEQPVFAGSGSNGPDYEDGGHY